MSRVLSLRPEPAHVRLARDFCTAELAAVLDLRSAAAEDVLDDAAMVTSELVTNSIRAGATAIELAVEIGLTDVRIVVSDDAEGAVEMAAPTPFDTSGRGLHIVARLAHEWGVEQHRTGKQVWAALNLPPNDAAEDHLTEAAVS